MIGKCFSKAAANIPVPFLPGIPESPYTFTPLRPELGDLLLKIKPEAEINLPLMSTDDTSRQIEKVLGKKPGDDLVQFIQEKSKGNPFYNEQLCSYLQQNKLLSVENEKIHSTGKMQDVPESLNSLLISTIDRMPDDL